MLLFRCMIFVQAATVLHFSPVPGKLTDSNQVNGKLPVDKPKR